MVQESMESEGPSAPEEEAAAEEPAEEAQEEPSQKKRRGRPPAKSKKSKGLSCPLVKATLLLLVRLSRSVAKHLEVTA